MKKRITMKQVMLCAGLLMVTVMVADAQSWNRGGNAGAGSTNLGFTDNQSVNFITNNAWRMRVHTNGVAIGDAAFTPAFLLHVRSAGTGSMQLESTTGNANMNLVRGAQGFGAGVTYKTGATNHWQTGLLANNDNYTIRNINLAASAISVLSSNNYVGIGNSSPDCRLHIDASSSMSGANGVGSFQIGLTSSYNLVMDNNEVYARFGGSPSTLFLQYWDAADLWACTGGGNAYFGGNVGVGTYPNYKLDVAGQTHVAADDNIGNYTGSPILAEVSSNSLYIPSISLYNGFSSTGSILYGGASGGATMLVYNGDGSGYAAINASAFNVSSDRTMKKDIVEVTSKDFEDYLNQIRNIESITYRYNNELTNSSTATEMYKVREVPHVGFTAQSLPVAVQTKIPASPKVNAELKLGYNLSDMAGLTLIGVKAIDARQTALEKENAELKNRLDKMEQALASCCTSSETKGANTTGSVDRARLEQNQPNPFSTQTKIKFYVPSNFTSAVVKVADLNGVDLKSFVVKSAGYGEVFINGNELAHGSYVYNLFVDGKQVDSKVMVLTK